MQKGKKEEACTIKKVESFLEPCDDQLCSKPSDLLRKKTTISCINFHKGKGIMPVIKHSNRSM